MIYEPFLIPPITLMYEYTLFTRLLISNGCISTSNGSISTSNGCINVSNGCVNISNVPNSIKGIYCYLCIWDYLFIK